MYIHKIYIFEDVYIYISVYMYISETSQRHLMPAGLYI